MLIAVAAVLVATAALLIVRLGWRARQTGDYGTLFAVLAAALVMGLALLAATGRLHWLAVAAAAVLPFLRRSGALLRYLPLLGRLFSRGRPGAGRPGGGPFRGAGTDTMTRDRALEILGLGPQQPTRAEVIAAHRRLMQRLHPDRGGSKYLAQQLNEAKQRLLEEPG